MEKQTLGTAISSLRKEQGMTQAQLAEKMNVTDKAVSKWERDLSCPDIGSLPKLAGIFGISVDELMQTTVCVEKEGSGNKTSKSIVKLIFKAIALAMGVAVTALSILKEIDTQSATLLLGIGLTCVAVSLLDKGSEK